MEECIFCKIIKKGLPSEIVFENEKVLAFRDINPRAALHILIAPKTHIASVASDGSENIVGDLVLAAKELAKKQGISSYKLVSNVGKEAGQTVEHLHFHFLAGKVNNPLAKTSPQGEARALNEV